MEELERKWIRVVGVGDATREAIKAVEGYGFRGVNCEVVTSPFIAEPGKDDMLAIIVGVDCNENASRIAKRFHEAGILTLGLVHDADLNCFDSVMEGWSSAEIPGIIRSIFMPLIEPGPMSYDFNDLTAMLKGYNHFRVFNTEGDSVKVLVSEMEKTLKEEGIETGGIDNISVHLFMAQHRQNPLTIADMTSISEMIGKLPPSVNVVWTVNYDDSLSSEQLRLTEMISLR